MPKYVEEREMPPVPGAFGVTMELGQWIRSHRADADFYEGTGPYKDCLRILIEEEYGYKTWLWTYFGTVEQLISDWKTGHRPVYSGTGRNMYGIPRSLPWSGELDEITWRPKYCAKTPAFQDPRELVWMNGIGEHPYIIETGYPVLCIDGIDGFDGTAHVHEHDDSVLDISFYKLRGLRDVEVEVVPWRVLGEMSKIA
jgi:hypothetical protein